jgi:hypothetical protein
VLDDVSANVLVRELKLFEVVVVEEMAERSVSDVVQQRGHSHERLDVRPRGNAVARFGERFVPVLQNPRGEMHRPEHVLEPHVFGGGKDPPGGLELMNLPQSLDPRVIDDVLFRNFTPGQRAA